jgi:hypothetical protein
VRIKPLAALALVATGISLAVVTPASALTKPQVFNLLEVSGRDVNLGPGTGFDENGPPTLGNRFAIASTLYKWAGRKRGARVGRLDGLCTVTKLDVAARSATVFCDATIYLPAGQLVAVATLNFSERSGPTFQVPIVGGTGAYAGARGFVKVTSLGDSDNSNDEFHLLP